MKNLKGLRFGKLTVLDRDETKKGGAAYWLCQCECGKTKSIRGSNLTAKVNSTKSCGCLNQGKNIDMNSILGNKYGKLTVIKRDLSKPQGHGFMSYWICKCECGQQVSVSKTSLIEGHTQSCGCLRSQLIQKKNTLNLIGKKYGYATVIKNTEKQNKRGCFLWLCQCDCGNTFIASSEYLNSGHINSCGCKNIKSLGEEKIYQILSDNNIHFAREFTFDDCRNPKTNRLYRYDFAILDNNNQVKYLIEFDGEQHFLNKDHWHFNIEEIQFNDNFKNKYAKKKNIPLIRIPHYDLNKINNLNDIFNSKYYN